MTPDEIARTAREQLLKWIDWYLAAFPDEAGSQEQLAARLGLSGAALSMWRKKGSTRYPNMKNLVRFYVLVRKAWEGVRIDDLLFRDPPPRPRR